jgi:hypothetical protein
MTNPSVLQQLAQEHQREILEASRTRRLRDPGGSGVRQRLGWSLIGLGVHLALGGYGRATNSWSGVSSGGRRQEWRPLARH